MDDLISENSRLRKELKANKTAYAKLNSEKDEAIKASSIALCCKKKIIGFDR